MTARPSMKDSFLKGIKDNTANIRSLLFNFDARDLPDAMELPDTTDMLINASALGQTLNSLSSLSTIIINLEYALDAHHSFLLASVVLACHNARRLIIIRGMKHPENLGILSTFIQGHPNLEHVDINVDEDVPEAIRNTLLRSLASLSKLKSVVLADTPK